MAEQATSGRQPPVPPEDAAALLTEVDRLEREVSRLRTTLVERDRELGKALGRVAQLEHQSRSFAMLARRVQARIPGAVGIRSRLRRRLRGGRG
jgi:hypothetical protein